jgi:predicted metal-dependent enzyme (double-stranded beta helix superfamily)
VLASRGDDSLSLFLTRFEPGHATPVHDHQTWGVLYVLEGRDHYTHWDVDYTAEDRSRAEVNKATGTLLVAGASVYWFPPPHDLHSQEALDGTVWELLVAGRNFLSPSVLGHRHYFDPKTGDVTHMPVK